MEVSDSAARRHQSVTGGADVDWQGRFQEGEHLLKLADHHAVLVAAMKCKQNATMDAVNALKAAVDKLETYYPKSE